MTTKRRPRGAIKAVTDALAASKELVPASTSFDLKPQSNFLSGPSGKPPLSLENSDLLGGRFAWTGWGYGTQVVQLGGLTEQNRVASTILPELFFRNSQVGAAVETIVVTTIGPNGLRVVPKLNADLLGISKQEARLLEKQIAARWQAYSTNARECDVTGRWNVAEASEIVLRSALLQGDALVAFPFRKTAHSKYYSKFECLASEQLDQTRTGSFDGLDVLKGVAFQNNNNRVGFYVREAKLGASMAAPLSKFESEYSRAGRRRLLHILAQPLESRAVRGVGITGVVQPAQNNHALSDALVGKAQAAASFAVTIKSDLDTRLRSGRSRLTITLAIRLRSTTAPCSPSGRTHVRRFTAMPAWARSFGLMVRKLCTSLLVIRSKFLGI